LVSFKLDNGKDHQLISPASGNGLNASGRDNSDARAVSASVLMSDGQDDSQSTTPGELSYSAKEVQVSSPGVVATFSEYFLKTRAPTAHDLEGLADVQRSVDLTVATVRASGNQEAISDLKFWTVLYDPTYVDAKHPKAIATTITQGTAGSEDDHKDINTLYGKNFDNIRNETNPVRTSDRITTSTKDARLLVIGLHELSHGSEGNRKITDDDDASERDVGNRVRELLKSSPDVKDGYR
jgi:hypothetical protein